MVLMFMAVMPVAYTNCSQQMDFDATEEAQLASLGAGGTVVINHGAPYTKSQSVMLNITQLSAQFMYVTNDPTCAAGGTWEPVATSKAWTLATTNGESSVYIKFSNDGDGGLASGCNSDSIVHDGNVPSLTVTQPMAAFSSVSKAVVGYATVDSGAGVDRVICYPVGSVPDSDTAGCGLTSMTVDNIPEGAHSFVLIAVDRAGNESPPQTVSFVIDRTPPSISLNMTPSSISNQMRSEFRMSSNDDRAGVDHLECRNASPAMIASTALAPCADTTVLNVAAGAQRFEVVAVDRAGNRSNPAAYNWTVDLASPTVMLTVTPSAYTNATQARFEFVGTDDSGPLARFECGLDGAAMATCSSPYVSDMALAAGSHQFSVVGIDSAGNRSEPASYVWTIDLEKPTIQFVSKPAPLTKNTRGDFVLSVNDNTGVDRIECQINNGGFAACPLTPSYPNLADGVRKFDARAVDRAGNTSDAITYSWTIDTSKPVLAITSAPTRWTNVRAASIVLSVTDTNAAPGLPAATIECRIDGSTYTACVSPVAYSALANGNHTFMARATDAAGNVSDEVSHLWGVDIDPPIVNVGKQPLSVIYVTDPADIAFVVTDSGSGIASVSCGLDGVMAACATETQKLYNNLATGAHVFKIVATDYASNEKVVEITWTSTAGTRTENQLVDVRQSNKLDVLVVIDNSGSMATEQANMAQRFGTFLDKLSGLNWQIGIVTTDISSNAALKDGRLVEFRDANKVATGQYVISSADNQTTARAWFGSTIQRTPSEGSGNEQGIAATYRAIERTKLTDSVSLRNVALFRSDAALAVLVVTDADETSPSGTQLRNKPEELNNLVRNTWPTKPFSYHSIIVPINDAACKGINGNEGYGYAYDTMSLLTGGIRGTVCSDDYAAQLSNIGQSTRDLISSVTLRCAPVDVTGDGKGDITITTSNNAPAPSYTIDGMRAIFATPLPTGVNTLTYKCPN